MGELVFLGFSLDSDKFLNINDSVALESLMTALKSENAILFVGAGCSARLGLPSWTSLLKDLVDLHGDLELDQYKIKNDIIKYAGEVKRKLFEKNDNSHSRYENYLSRRFKNPEDGYLENTELHDLIVQWPEMFKEEI